MKVRRSLLSLVATLVLVLLAACGGTAPTPQGAAPSEVPVFRLRRPVSPNTEPEM